MSESVTCEHVEEDDRMCANCIERLKSALEASRKELENLRDIVRNTEASFCRQGGRVMKRASIAALIVFLYGTGFASGYFTGKINAYTKMLTWFEATDKQVSDIRAQINPVAGPSSGAQVWAPSAPARYVYPPETAKAIADACFSADEAALIKSGTVISTGNLLSFGGRCYQDVYNGILIPEPSKAFLAKLKHGGAGASFIGSGAETGHPQRCQLNVWKGDKYLSVQGRDYDKMEAAALKMFALKQWDKERDIEKGTLKPRK